VKADTLRQAAIGKVFTTELTAYQLFLSIGNFIFQEVGNVAQGWTIFSVCVGNVSPVIIGSEVYCLILKLKSAVMFGF
jgi:hypothetical protein